MFEHKCIFKVKKTDNINIEELEFELIDSGGEEVFVDENDVVIYGAYEAYGAIQKYIEENNFEMISAGFDRLPTVELKELTPEQQVEIEKLIDKFEDDDDVQNVYHIMKMAHE